MSDDIDTRINPVSVFGHAGEGTPNTQLELGHVVSNNSVCPTGLSRVISNPENGVLAQLIELVELRTDIEFSGQLEERVNDLRDYVLYLKFGIEQAGYGISTASKVLSRHM